MRAVLLRDRLFWICCGCYALNRWCLRTRVSSVFLRSWFNDLLLVPCAIPVLFWCLERCKLREQAAPPGLFELGWIVGCWSVLFEWVGPNLIPHATADWRDTVMYCLGGLGAWLYWRRKAPAGR